MGMEALVTMFLSKSNVEGETRNQIDPTVNLGEPRVTSMAVDTNPSMSFPELQEPNRKYGKRYVSLFDSQDKALSEAEKK
ncbi:hypothetical protein V6N13_103477 [Hibiscus sabdariffa]